MNVFLLSLLQIFFIAGIIHPVFAVGGGDVNISALVSETATSTVFSFTVGGTTTLANSNNTAVLLSFPSDFYSEDLLLRANSYANNFFAADKPAPSKKNFIGKTYDFNFYTASGSSVSAISKPATITISYTDDDVSGIDENALAPYRWGASDSAWQLISGSTIDTVDNKVTFSSALFSSFAIFGSPASSPPPSQSGGGSGGGGGGGSSGGDYIPPETGAVSSSNVYPFSPTALLKDAQETLARIIDGLGGVFHINAGNGPAGNIAVGTTTAPTTHAGGISAASTTPVDNSQIKKDGASATSEQSLFPSITTFGISRYWIASLISLAEALPFIDLIIPGTFVVVFFGFLSAQGYFDIRNLIWFIAIGAILGDSISYYLGSKGIVLFRNENKLLKLSYLEKGEEFFQKRGAVSILFGRFIGVLRPVIPFVAGLSKMDMKIFFFWNVISGILWSTVFLLLGYLFGSVLTAVETWFARAEILLLVASIIVIRTILRRKRR